MRVGLHVVVMTYRVTIMETAFIGVGSNLGERLNNIDRAVKHLQSYDGIYIEKVSSIIETEPESGPSQPHYLNGVIKIKTSLTPRQLLHTLQVVEAALGRKRTVKNGPRTIDLDILLYGDKIVKEKDLTIPHPRMFKRDFVMKPLLEVEPRITALTDNLKDRDDSS